MTTTQIIKMFDVDDKAYYHVFDYSDDSVHLYDEDERELLIYTYDCYVKNPKDGCYIGRLSLTDRSWVFRLNDPNNDKIVLRSNNTFDVLDFEVDVSKYYIEHLLDKEVQINGVH